ncbi:hypothetical protein HAX54_020548 [Datura stramonium]|uniref:Uncharacterized protein n=1 Tax=Datura stramonium TaxID=4076 RepID=A0ABS8UT98_DATST|nr:hypothetical protein [Datura stramonium]
MSPVLEPCPYLMEGQGPLSGLEPEEESAPVECWCHIQKTNRDCSTIMDTKAGKSSMSLASCRSSLSILEDKSVDEYLELSSGLNGTDGMGAVVAGSSTAAGSDLLVGYDVGSSNWIP